MAKTITFTFEKTAYTLEYTRETVSIMEQNGLKLSDIQNLTEDKPLTTIMVLFRGAFLAHHKRAASITGLVERIWESVPDKGEMLKVLIEMYTEPLQSLLSDPEDEKGKTSWTVNE